MSFGSLGVLNRLGDLGGSASDSGPAAYSWTNSEGSDFEAQCDTTGWDDGFRGDVDQLISDLKSGTINATNTYSGFDRILLMDAPNEADSLRYLNAPTVTATNVNSTAFAATEGFTGDGAADYINTNYNPTDDGTQYTQNSASMGVWVRTADSGNFKAYIGAQVASPSIIDAVMSTTAAWIGYGPSDIVSLAGTTAGATGLLVANRSGSAARQVYRNGVSEGTNTQASVGLLSRDVYLLCYNSTSGTPPTPSNFTVGQISLFFAGRSFTAAEQADIHAAFEAYRTAREAA